MKRTFDAAFVAITNQDTKEIVDENNNVDLTERFKIIESIISVNCRNAHQTTWEMIQEAFENASGNKLYVESFDEVVWFSGDLYNISWKEDVRDTNNQCLCIEFNAASDCHCGHVSKPFSPEYMNLRLKYFGDNLKRISCYQRISPNWYDKAIAGQVASKNQNASLSSSAGSLRSNEILKIVATPMADKVLKASNTIEDNIHTTNSSSSSSLGDYLLDANAIKGIDKLREESIRRGAMMEQQEHHLQREKAKNIEIKRISTLPSLADILRSNALIGNRLSCPLRELSINISRDLRITEIEFLLRIQSLASIVPEFINILSPDDVVRVTTVTLNMDAIYEHVREKLKTFVRNKIAKLREESEIN